MNNKAGDLLTATGAPGPGCVSALRSPVSICGRNPAAESCLRKVQQWKMLRCIAIWRKSTWRKRQVPQPRPSLFLQAHFEHCVGARRNISIWAYMNIPWKFSIGAGRSYLCLCCFCCVQTTCSLYPCSFLSPSWERGGEGGDVCFSQSCLGSCAHAQHCPPPLPAPPQGCSWWPQ